MISAATLVPLRSEAKCCLTLSVLAIEEFLLCGNLRVFEMIELNNIMEGGFVPW